MRRTFALLSALSLGACSFNTQSLVSGNRDATSESFSDATSDAMTDVTPDVTPDVATDASPDAIVDAGRTAVGIWRVTSAMSPLGTITDTGVTRANGLVHFTPTSASVSYATVTGDYAHLTHGTLGCPNPRMIDFAGRGVLGTLDDSANTFRVTEGLTPPTFRISWVDDQTMDLTYHVLIDVTFRLQRLTFPPPADSYQRTVELEIGDMQCVASSEDRRQKAVLLWEHGANGRAIPAGPAVALNRASLGESTFAQVSVNLHGQPPAEAMGTADGVRAAIAYIVVFRDDNDNDALDHAYTSATSSGDRVLGVSNVAIVWRDQHVPHTGRETSSFIDTRDGYQTVTIGADSRSNGGTAPWVVDASDRPLHTGAFADDPTHPVIASGLMQAREVTAALPDLLR